MQPFSFKVLFLLNTASITPSSASVSPSSKHLLYEISNVSRLVLSINRLTAASGPRSLGIRYNDLSVLHLRMALIERSSALLMWQLVSDLIKHGLVVKELRTIHLNLRHVSELLNCSAFGRALVCSYNFAD